jgi:predicted transcriptional regulator
VLYSFAGGTDGAQPAALPVDRGRPHPYLGSMEVHFTPEQEARLSQIATHAGTDPEHLVKDAALRLLQEEEQFRAAVREGIAAADRGEFVEHEEVWANVEKILRS